MNVIYETPGETFHMLDANSDIWFMTDGFKLVPRATIEISPHCPKDCLAQVQRAIANGYIKPIVYMREKDYVWATLEK